MILLAFISLLNLILLLVSFKILQWLTKIMIGSATVFERILHHCTITSTRNAGTEIALAE